MTNADTTLLAQLRAILDLTNTEIQIAETRVGAARCLSAGVIGSRYWKWRS